MTRRSLCMLAFLAALACLALAAEWRLSQQDQQEQGR